ncbi:hypothetical protein FQZ97_963560 [compost metagenome]
MLCSVVFRLLISSLIRCIPWLGGSILLLIIFLARGVDVVVSLHYSSYFLIFCSSFMCMAEVAKLAAAKGLIFPGRELVACSIVAALWAGIWIALLVLFAYLAQGEVVNLKEKIILSIAFSLLGFVVSVLPRKRKGNLF